MKKRARPGGEMRVPDYTLAYLVREGYAAGPKKVRSAKRIALVLILGMLAALLAGAGIWYWSAGSKSMGGRHTPGSSPQQSGRGVPSAGALPAAWNFVKTVNFLGIRPFPSWKIPRILYHGIVSQRVSNRYRRIITTEKDECDEK